MVNHTCMAIGINRYQFLPPLSYGQADAQALGQFLVNQANLPSNLLLLLTDTSPQVAHQSTYPTQDNILTWLEAERQNSLPSDNWRWFFFSGYGVCWEDIDYLMPIDGNPHDIPGTGIPMRSLFASLNPSGNDNILVFLDINRSSGQQGSKSVGAQTIELADEMGISLVLSSQLDQFSHEATALGNGLFTAALLEALRYYHSDVTLENLDQYLRDRLPELSQHHWRPIQNPLTFIPFEEVGQQLILPTVDNSVINEKTAALKASAFKPLARQQEKTPVEASSNGAGITRQKTAAAAVGARLHKPVNPMPLVNQTANSSMTMALSATPQRQSPESTANTTLWRQLLVWGGGALLILSVMIVALVFRLRNTSTSTYQQALETPQTKTLPNTAPLANTKASPTNSLKSPTNLSTAQSRLQANQADLEEARRLIQANQASLFNKAIIQAQKVLPGDPLYKQAQQDISRWSQVILDLAQGRAAKKNFGEAIAAAQLIPRDDASIYTKAQQTIVQWKMLAKQLQQNQAVIVEAKSQLQSNQASSYRRAITTLSKVSSGQPGYAEAQQLKEEWSRKIYLIAQSRASQGKFESAVQTATLVPTNTSSSEASQKAIAKWKTQKR